jgi:uncharacterized protein (TIRG00374 family)
MNKILRRILALAVFLGLGIFLVWLVTHNLTPDQWKSIRTVFRDANYVVLIPVFIIGALSHFLRALRWRLLFQPMGYQPGILSTFCAVMIGYLANLALPRMGEISRCGVLSRNDRIPFDKVLGTMIAERGIDLICLVVLLAIAVLIQINIVGRFFYDLVVVRFTRLFRERNITTGILILGGIIVLGALVWFLVKKFKTTLWFRKVMSLLQGIRKGIFSIRRIDRKGVFFLYTVAIWICYFLMVYVGFYCLKPTTVLGIKPALSVLGFGSIGMLVTQGGIGAYQLIVEKVLDLYGIAEAYGYAFGWLSWLAQTLLTMVLGFGSMLAIPFIRRKPPADLSPVDAD